MAFEEIISDAVEHKKELMESFKEGNVSINDLISELAFYRSSNTEKNMDIIRGILYV